MFREPTDRLWGERPRDAEVLSLREWLMSIAIGLLGLLDATLYLVVAPHATTDGAIAIALFTVVTIVIARYVGHVVQMMVRELRLRKAKKLQLRTMRRMKVFQPPWQ